MNQKRPTAYDGVDNLGKQPALTPEQKHQIEILQDNFFNCFNSDAGKKVMQHFEEKFIQQPVAIPEMGITGIPAAYFRDGENNLIRYIKALMQQSELRRKKNG